MIFILFFIIIFAEKSQIMKKIVFLFLICMPICQVVSAQTLKKQNQMLKDSIGIMHKVIDEKSSVNVRNRYAAWWNSRQERMLSTLRKSRVDLATIATNDDFVVALMTLFKRRG